MPPSHTPEDTRDLLAAGLRPPARTRHTWMGGCFFAAALLWLFAIIGCIRAVAGEMPNLYAVALLIAAGTMTVVTCTLAAILAMWRAMCTDHKALSTDIGRIAAQQEQISAKVGQIDPWTIYAAVAADVLGVDHHPGPKP